MIVMRPPRWSLPALVLVAGSVLPIARTDTPPTDGPRATPPHAVLRRADDALPGIPATPAVPTGRTTDAADCGRCHAEIHDEWHGSAHGRAWTDPIYQRTLDGLEHPERCHGCHVPDSVLGRLGRPPRPRDGDLDAGVTCVACHQDRSGAIAGPFGAKTDAHATIAHPAFKEAGSTALCSSCHDLRIGPVLPLARDFEAAGLADRGKSCIGCHMPRMLRPIAVDPDTGEPTGPERRGRSHALRGPSDPDFAASAFKIAVRAVDERSIELALGNRAGHRVPGLVGRRFVFDVVQFDASDRRITADAVTISDENLLLVAETRRFPLARRTGCISVEVRVRHLCGDLDIEIDRRRHDLR